MKSIGMATAGSDMVIKFMPDGTPVGEVSLAVRTGKKDKEGGYITQWYKATMFGKRAETLAQYITKGSKHCYVLADIIARQYTAKDGTAGVSLEAKIDDVELGGKSDKQSQPAPTAAPKVAVSDFADELPFAHHGKCGAGVSWRDM